MAGDQEPLADLGIQLPSGPDDVENAASLSFADQVGVGPGRAKSLAVGPDDRVPGREPVVELGIDIGDIALRRVAVAVARGGARDPTARPPTDFTGDTGAGDLWTASPTFDWAQSPAGHALSYLSSPLSSDTAVIGAGALTAWVKASAPSVDLQVTVSEVRPDDNETFVQGGWLRTSARKLDPAKSTPLEPVLSLRKRDAAPLPNGHWAKIVVPLYYEGHMYRAGSRIRVTIAAVGGDQPIWAFGEAQPDSPANVLLAHSKQMPSRLDLPVVAGPPAPTTLPPCPGLRGEPCRAYVPFSNDEHGAPSGH